MFVSLSKFSLLLYLYFPHSLPSRRPVVVFQFFLLFISPFLFTLSPTFSQILPLLMKHFTREEQSLLVWQLLCCIPVNLMENYLQWMASSLSQEEFKGLMTLLESVVPGEDLRQHVSCLFEPLYFLILNLHSFGRFHFHRNIIILISGFSNYFVLFLVFWLSSFRFFVHG